METLITNKGKTVTDDTIDAFKVRLRTIHVYFNIMDKRNLLKREIEDFIDTGKELSELWHKKYVPVYLEQGEKVYL